MEAQYLNSDNTAITFSHTFNQNGSYLIVITESSLNTNTYGEPNISGTYNSIKQKTYTKDTVSDGMYAITTAIIEVDVDDTISVTSEFKWGYTVKVLNIYKIS